MDIENENTKDTISGLIDAASEMSDGQNTYDKLKDLAACDWFLYLITGEENLATRIAKKFGFIYYGSFD